MTPARRARTAPPAPDGLSPADRKTFPSTALARFLRAKARRNGTGPDAAPSPAALPAERKAFVSQTRLAR